MSVPWRLIGSAFIGVMMIGGLGACQNGHVFSGNDSPDAGEYPSLRSVPLEARPSSSIEERRQIVRTLLDERDQSRRQTAIVRSRSGLSVDPPPAFADGDTRAEDIVPDQPLGDGEGFRLTPGDGDETGAVYRTDRQFDDGSLDDFIRQLKRDTLANPNPPAETEEPLSEELDEEDVSVLFSESRTLASLWERREQPILQVGFAPAIVTDPLAERDVMIRLAAAEEEPGFFCRYLGWSIAWSSMCVAETDAEPQQDSDEDVGADLEQELRQSPEEDGTGGAARSGSPSSTEAGRERAERRLSEEDAAEAIEDAGRSALAPVTNSLEKLRDFMNSKRSRGTDTSSEERAPSYRSDARSDRTAAIDRPPTPERRPKRREDLAIEDEGETFTFQRTPLPAFKPTPDEPVILKAKNEYRNEPKPVRRYDPPPIPLLRPGDLPAQPSDLLSELKGEGAETTNQDAGERPGERSAALALASEVDHDGDREAEALIAPDVSAALPTEFNNEAGAKAPLSTPDPASAAASTEAPLPVATDRASMVIAFEPETPGLPKGMWPRLAALLDDARAGNQKIHIIGEASTNHVARRRATDVGAALVQLGATVEILEYDHEAKSDVDQVRLVLRPAAADPLAGAKAPAVIEK